MLTVQIVSILVSGLIAYYMSRRGPSWKIIPALVLGLIGGWVVGMPIAAYWADGNTAAIGRGIGAAFWFSLVGSIGGIWFGRSKASQQSLASQRGIGTARPTSSEDNPREPDNNLKVARLEASLGKYKSDVLTKAKKVCSENPSLLIDDVYVFLRSKELESVANVSPTASDDTESNSSSDRTGQVKAEQSYKTPQDPVMYVVTALVVVGVIAIYGSDHIKLFVAGFMDPTNNESVGGDEHTARPAGGEQVAGSGWHICNNQ
ncbi:MAG: hypothetical protein U5R46_17550 [Gammaproteobacteria bacterium]|nr:hypothetical protein [Gammaproteobacteria bacterium]